MGQKSVTENLQLNNNKRPIYQNLWDRAKEMLRKEFIGLNNFIRKEKTKSMI